MYEELNNYFQYSDAVDFCSGFDERDYFPKKRKIKSYIKPTLWKPVSIGRRIFRSLKEAAKSNNITSSNMCYRLKSNLKRYENYKYISQDEYDKMYLENIKRDKHKCRSVEIHGIVYLSIKEAAEKTKFTRRQIAWRASSDKPKWSTFKWVDRGTVKKKSIRLKIKKSKVPRIFYLRNDEVMDFIKGKVFKHGRSYKPNNTGNIREDKFGGLYYHQKPRC